MSYFARLFTGSTDKDDSKNTPPSYPNNIDTATNNRVWNANTRLYHSHCACETVSSLQRGKETLVDRIPEDDGNLALDTYIVPKTDIKRTLLTPVTEIGKSTRHKNRVSNCLPIHTGFQGNDHFIMNRSRGFGWNTRVPRGIDSHARLSRAFTLPNRGDFVILENRPTPPSSRLIVRDTLSSYYKTSQEYM